MSDDEDINTKAEQKSATPFTPVDQMMNGDGLKRKRESEEGSNGIKVEDEDATPNKRPRSTTPPAPPPPPPPPIDGELDDEVLMDQDRDAGSVLTFGVSHLVNGNGTLDSASPSDQMEDIDALHPPPPPPPPPPPTDALEDIGDIDQKQGTTQAMIDAFPTPDNDSDTNQLLDQAVKQIKTETFS